ncbi:Cupin-like domain-containing protein [Christiangramia gaetbulicola]|uniref:Cupin-like domain-containing protein n=1 Tax=Christiangramia gaetbulicola TaxID=703340 RepID=A0A2T6ALM1_9FLAO|nr:cupin-like domain-containing protein [Christiangramia gaetbulicola]PTX44728.1 Cupin-like domain-containing protein [Christiangramia gaetbulicola]
MKLDLQNIPRRKDLSKEEFLQEYFIPKKPVVIEDLTKNWPAYKKWSFEYFREKAGEVVVPLYDGKPAKGRQNSHGVAKKIPFKEYIDILEQGPTDLRMFFFNLLKNCPELLEDFEYPDLGVKFFKKLPVLFVGGEGSKVVMHYDMDLANNFHFNFVGEKKVILYPPDQTGLIYKVPYSIVSMEIIDMDDPDLEKYPALAQAKGFETRLKHGDALYIPSHWWHFIKYETASLSMTLRSLPKSPKQIAEVLNNLLFMRNYDNLMRKLKGQKWIDHKNEIAIKRTHKNAGIE